MKQKPFYKKTCPICGTEFSSYLKSAKYCSKDCAVQAEKLRHKKINENKVKKILVKTCANCGKQFETSRSRQIFCSKLCQNEHKKAKARKKNVVKKCVVCGKDFQTNNPENIFTCCTKCSKIRQLQIAKAKRKQLCKKVCPVCGGEFETVNPNKIYCSISCQRQVKLEKRTKGKAETLIKKCEVCGKEFETKQPAVVTCSKECSYIRKLERDKQKRKDKQKVCLKICLVCGNNFIPTLGHNDQKFCSEKCRHSYNVVKTLENRKTRRLAYKFRNEEYVEIHRDIFHNLLCLIFKRDAERKNPVKKKPLDDWIKEADICGLSYGYYRAYIEIFGKTFEELMQKNEIRGTEF